MTKETLKKANRVSQLLSERIEISAALANELFFVDAELIQFDTMDWGTSNSELLSQFQIPKGVNHVDIREAIRVAILHRKNQIDEELNALFNKEEN